MSSYSLLAIAGALAMDAFAVAIVVGITLQVMTKRHLFRLGFHFGLFQAGMTALGWYFGRAVKTVVSPADDWIAFALLVLVGGNIIRGAWQGHEEAHERADPTSGWTLVVLSFATSLDALAVGLSLALIGSGIAKTALVIGLMATTLTLIGMGFGRRISALWGRRVELLGGLILIVIGISIVWGHLRL